MEQILVIISEKHKKTKSRYNLLKNYIYWIANNNISKVENEIIVPHKPKKYIKPHLSMINNKFLLFKQTITINNIVYYHYHIDCEKLNKYLKKLKKTLSLYTKTMKHIKQNIPIKSRTPIYRLIQKIKERNLNE